MALSSILRTPAHVLRVQPWFAAELVDERRPVAPRRGLRDLERHDDSAVGISVDDVLDDRISRLGLVAEARRDVSQNIPHIIPALPVLVVAEPAPHEDGTDAIFK